MNPEISDILENNGELGFTLKGVNVSIANALRRIIIAHIPTVIIRTELYEQNECTIHKNTTRQHNEIIKHRLSCIPVHIDFTEHARFIETTQLEVAEKNTEDYTKVVTTEQFRLKNKQTGDFLAEEATHRVFPPCEKTQCYIDLVRLRPKISDTILGEEIHLTANFSVGTANENSCFTVVSKCAYANTPDTAAAETAWKKQEEKLRELSKNEIEFHRRNFAILDAQRYFHPNSYDFVVKSIGVYSNISIIWRAAQIMQQFLQDRMDELDTGAIIIKHADSTMPNCFDVVLQKEDYTVGKVLEFMLHEMYFRGGEDGKDKLLKYCGFKKFHPHDPDSIIRLTYDVDITPDNIRGHIRAAATRSVEIFQQIEQLFSQSRDRAAA